MIRKIVDLLFWIEFHLIQKHVEGEIVNYIVYLGKRSVSWMNMDN